MNLRALKNILPVPACLLILACGSKVTAENFEKIQTGMSQQDVVALLGEPTQSYAFDIAGLSGAAATWREGETTISIQFFNGKVQARQLSRGAGAPAPRQGE